MLMGWRKSVIGIGGIATAIVRTTDLTIDPMPITVRITDLTMATTATPTTIGLTTTVRALASGLASEPKDG
jgi:hypothetical protein